MSLDVNISEPDEFNCNELHNIIEEIAETQQINNFVYHVDNVCEKGENYVANVFKVHIHEENDKEKSIKVIVKTLINTTRQNLFHDLHEREVIAYDEILPKFQQLQELLCEDDKIYIANKYIASAEFGKEVLVLEDLLESGFVMKYKMDELDYEHVNTVLASLAKFHALSFIFENDDPDTFQSLKSKFDDVVFKDEFLDKSNLRDYFVESFRTSIKVVKDLSVKEKLETIASSVIERMKGFVKPAKYNVLCHGDFWINNILWKYEGEKTKLCFLDFQAMRYSSPVTDILYFIYLCTNSKFRQEHFLKLQKHYYNSLKQALQHHNIDVNVAYTEKCFMEDIIDYEMFGFIVAMTEIKIVTVKSEDETLLLDLNSFDFKSEAPNGLRLFVDRVNDVVQEFKNNGVLENL